jgi:hypothetical protein
MPAAAAAKFNPWTALALGGSSILEALINKLFFGPPKEVRRATKQAATKASELLSKPGYSQEAIQAIFGKNFENVRGQGKNVRQSTTEALGRAGALGTGTDVAMARKNAWSNENLVTEAMRDLLIAGEAKKSSDIALAGNLLGTSAQTAQLGMGEGPALTEGLLTAILMGQKNKPALGQTDWDEIFNQYGSIAGRGTFGSYNFGAPIAGNPDSIWNG